MATPEETEAAVQRATEELTALRRDHPEAITIVSEWWKRHYGLAGHRRLGRLLLGTNPERGGRDRD